MFWFDGFALTENPVDPTAVTPGIEGFTAIAVLAILVFGLCFFIVRTLRRMNYREEVQQQIAAELAARDEAAAPSKSGAAAGADPTTAADGETEQSNGLSRDD